MSEEELHFQTEFRSTSTYEIPAYGNKDRHDVKR